MGNKRVILVHGWGGTAAWFPWTILELQSRKFKVDVFDMPNTVAPKIHEWVPFLNKKVANPDKNTYFIGHSIGCQTILRYLEILPENVKIGGCLFVAPWFNLGKEAYEDPEDEKTAMPWIKTPINFKKIKMHTDNFIAIFSNNDPYVPLSDIKLFEKNLGAKTILEKNQGHFNDNLKFPSLLKELEVMAK